MDRLITWFINRFRPQEGWVIFCLTLIILTLGVQSVHLADWVPEIRIIWVPFFSAIFITYAFIWRTHVRPWIHWPIIVGYLIIPCGLAFIGFRPFLLINGDWATFQSEFNLNWAVFWARISGWTAAINNQQESAETIVFALGLALLVGIVVSISIWAIYRQKQPVIVIFLLLLLIGLNNFFSGNQNASILLIIVLSIIYLALWRQQFHELLWDAENIDYSADMRMTNSLVTAGIALALIFAGIFLPALPYSSIARSFQQSAFAQAFDDTFAQIFSGVRTANTGGGGQEGAGGAGASVGVMPRSYLLGNAPELADTPIFLAEVDFEKPVLGPKHWRSGSFDIYTGRGWRQSLTPKIVPLETQESVPRLVPIYVNESNIMVSQRITWFADGRLSNLFTLGIPTGFAHPVNAYVRPTDDLSHVRNPTETYQPGYSATSTLVNRNPFVLNQLTIQDQDSDFYIHYTQLPASIPERVLTLSEQITADASTPFEQAVLIEQYLRQYPYNLEIPPIPEGVDPVDYFLFDLQEGYCDLYASSMVVMARSVGLPARLGIGYLNPQARPDGKYLITQDLGHSWAEIYFPDVGWVEFEPTASFPLTDNNQSVAQNEPETIIDPQLPDLPEPPSIPESQVDQPTVASWVWWTLIGLALLLLAIAITVIQNRRPPESIEEAFRWLQRAADRFGYPINQSETVAEFGDGLRLFLDRWLDGSAGKIDVQALSHNITQLVDDFETDRYSSAGLSDQAFNQSLTNWSALQAPIKRLRWRRRWQTWMNRFR